MRTWLASAEKRNVAFGGGGEVREKMAITHVLQTEEEVADENGEDEEEGIEGEESEKAAVDPEAVFGPDDDGHGGGDGGGDSGDGAAPGVVLVAHPDEEIGGAEFGGECVVDEIHELGATAAHEDAVVAGVGVAPEPEIATPLGPAVLPLPEL